MCGIIGLVNFEKGEELAKNGLLIMKNRGIDSTNVLEYKNMEFGHNLHSIVDFVKQPLKSRKGILVINGEIYNWKDLAKKYNFKVKNDSELVLRLLDKFGIKNIKKAIEELDGVFALAYFAKKEQKLVLARDIVGVVPLVYSFEKSTFAFASEKKAFNFETINLNPRKILILDTKLNKKGKMKIKFLKRKIKKIKPKKPKAELEKLLVSSVAKRIPEKPFALLLSGGIDSYLLGQVLNTNKIQFRSYFAAISELTTPKDLEYAENASIELDSPLIKKLVTLNEYEKNLPKIISLIESADPVRVGVASVLYFATRDIEERVVFSGLGADELFAGYNRFKNSNDINKDCYSYFIKMYENDLYYQNIILMNNKVELRLPYLDKDFAMNALGLAPKNKINDSQNKIFLREFSRDLGAEEKFFSRAKKAAQYGSNFDRALGVLAKKAGFRSKAKYLSEIQKLLKKDVNPKRNIKIASLLSTGKDSLYATNLMKKQGYDISCFVTIDSKNKDSFMFHTPTIKLAEKISKASKIPLIKIETKGEKEKELNDLKIGIKKAIDEYKIEGVVSGALYSNYQRQRIEKICEDLGIRAFAPLWHMDQSEYLRRVIKEGFSVMITKIAAHGLSENWVGKIIKNEDIDRLVTLEKKYKFNVAGEGGEYETLVVDAPFYNKKLDVKFDKKMENEFTGEIKINKVKLIKK
jgi:diphthine-ammonia ligase